MRWLRDKTKLKAPLDSRVYIELNDLVRLEYKARGFSLLPRQPVKGPLSGRHGSKLRGRGLNFEELRHYRQGDDIRTMDWKVTNRTGKPHIRVYTEERERSVYILLDQRSSMFFGSQEYMKSVIAAEVAALLAWKVVQTSDKVGLMIFNDEESRTIRPNRSHLHVIRLLSEVVAFNHALKAGVTPQKQAINKAFKDLAPQLPHDALLIYVGDGFGWDDETSGLVRRFVQHNDVMSVGILDKGERTLPSLEQLIISDGNQQVAVSGRSDKLQDAFAEDVERELGTMRRELRKYEIPFMNIDTSESASNQLVKAFAGR